jgi:hypothetical protein
MTTLHKATLFVDRRADPQGLTAPPLVMHLQILAEAYATPLSTIPNVMAKTLFRAIRDLLARPATAAPAIKSLIPGAMAVLVPQCFN